MGRKKKDLGAVEEEVLETPVEEAEVEETPEESQHMRWNSDCLEFGIYA